MKYLALAIPYNGTYRIHCIWLNMNNNRLGLDQYSHSIENKMIFEVEELSDIKQRIKELTDAKI